MRLPNFQYDFGYKKILDNWYKCNLVDYYTIPYLAEDPLAMEHEYPEFFSVGGNTGETNPFTGVDVENLAGRVFNASNLLQGSNATCVDLEASFQEAPDILSGLYSDISSVMDLLGATINTRTNGLRCPKLNQINKGQFVQYPGYTQLKSDGTY